MSTGYPEYVDALKNIVPNKDLFSNVKRLKQPHQRAVIKDILSASLSDEFKELLKKEPIDLSSFFLAEEIALHWLANCDPAWLKKHSDTIEDLFLESLKDKKEKNREIYNRIKLLVEHSRVGLRITFLEDLLKDVEERTDIKTATEIFLLIAKIEENIGHLDLQADRWRKIDLSEKPWLIAVIIYIYRKEKLSVILEKVWAFDEAWSKGASEYEGELEEVRPFLVSYFRQCLFKGLYDAEEEAYSKYISFEKSIQGDYLLKIIEEVLDHQAMKEIKDQLVSRAQESHQADRKLTHNEKLEVIEKTIPKE